MTALLNPVHRVETARTMLQLGQGRHPDPKVNELVACMRGESDDADLMYAWEKFEQPKSRYILNAFMLADTTYDVIRQATDRNRVHLTGIKVN